MLSTKYLSLVNLPSYRQTRAEFLNVTFQKRLADLGIQFYVNQNEDIKASIVERFNRTFKMKMWKYFTYRNTAHYLDVLDDLLHSYNRRGIKRSDVHRSKSQKKTNLQSEKECTAKN